MLIITLYDVKDKYLSRLGNACYDINILKLLTFESEALYRKKHSILNYNLHNYRDISFCY